MMLHLPARRHKSHKPTEGDHVDHQIEQIVFFLFFMFNCDIKVINGKYVNNHVID